MPELIPLKLLREYSREFPKAWREIAAMREDRGKGLPYWPEWCYCPIAGSVAVITKHAQTPQEELLLLKKTPPSIISALAAWRVTKGIYRFDETLLEEIANMPLEGKLPSEVFYQLPEWCIYVETPGLKFGEGEVEGFFTFLECDANDHRHEIRFEFVSKELTTSRTLLHLNKKTIGESIISAFDEAKRVVAEWPGGMNIQAPPPLNEDIISELIKEMQPFLNLVLYICSVNSDLTERPTHPSQKPRRKGKIQTAGQIKVWDVGTRVGTAIRSFKTENRTPEDGQVDSEAGAERSSPRPHYRRAHWHSYWTGPRDKPEARKLILKWLPPIPVGIKKLDENEAELQPAVIYPIKGE